MSNGSFELKRKFSGYGDMFKPTDPDIIASKAISGGVSALRLDALRPYKDHPFKAYEGQRFDDMVQSIRDNGVIMPIIVRPIVTAGESGGENAVADDAGASYEILSGHNRAAAAKAAGLETIPAIVREGLTNEEALLIVTETNLIQRSFSDMSHSERAVTLAMHHEAVKKQGKRTDLIAEIENMLNASDNGDSETFSPMGKKLNNVVSLGQEYGLAKNTVARYLRVNKLIDPFKKRLDNGELAIRTAVALSYLSEVEQFLVDDFLVISPLKVDMKKAEALKTISERGTLDAATVERILTGVQTPKPTRPAAFKLKHKIVSRYFSPAQKPQEIEDTIMKALDYYFAHVKADNHEIAVVQEDGYTGGDNAECGEETDNQADETHDGSDEIEGHGEETLDQGDEAGEKIIE